MSVRCYLAWVPTLHGPTPQLAFAWPDPDLARRALHVRPLDERDMAQVLCVPGETLAQAVARTFPYQPPSLSTEAA
jgi:hypothetical protein